MRASVLRIGVFTACALLTLDAGLAQIADPQRGGRQNYNIQPMNFDLWCQETQRYSVDRCDERWPEDQREFVEYRAIIERYELQYLMKQERDAAAEGRLGRDYGPSWDRYNNR